MADRLVDAIVPRAAAGGVALVAAVVVTRLRRRYVVITVRGASMEPALREGERVVVRRRPLSGVDGGDVVVFAETPDLQGLAPASVPPGPPASSAAVPDVMAAAPAAQGQWLIKRVVAVPGDAVPRAGIPALAGVDHDVVPAGAFVVLGDNAVQSHDSRAFGYVAGDRLLGVVLRKLGGGRP